MVSARFRNVQIHSRMLHQLGVIMYFKFMYLLYKVSAKEIGRGLNKRYPSYAVALKKK